MPLIGKIAAIAAAVIVVGVLGAAGFVYFRSEAIVHARFPLRPEPVRPSEAPNVARGGHLVDIMGCRGCHGRDLRGAVFDDAPDVVMAYPVNLTLWLKSNSREDLSRVLRQGVKPSGEGVTIMPSNGFMYLTDQELADADAYLRSVPAGGKVQPQMKLTWKGRLGVALGKFTPAIHDVQDGVGKLPADVGPKHAMARHLVAIACTECHGPELKGHPGDPGEPARPDLLIAASYDLPTFQRFLRTGVAMDGKQKWLMSDVARSRFSHFSDDEVKAIHAYLTARAEAAH
jgi:mono/diheme cytochrome c family protein